MPRTPVPDLKGWSAALVILGVAGILQVIQVVHEPSEVALEGTAAHADLMNSIAVLASAALVYLEWRITANEVMAWLAPGLLGVGLAGAGLVALTELGGPEASAPAGWPVVMDLVLGLVLLGSLVLSRGRFCVTHPLVAGLGAGITLVTVPLALLDSGALPPLSAPLRTMTTLLLAATYAATVVAAGRLAPCPTWFRVQLSCAVALLGCSQLTAHSATGPGADFLVMVTGAAGTAALWGASYVVVQQAFRESLQSLAEVQAEVRELETRSRADRERMHEIEATLAGITTAAGLLNAPGTLTPDRRRVVEHMVRSEASRLHRLVQAEHGRSSCAFDIDEIVRPLVERQRVRGATVEWRPTGLVALGDPDEVATALSVLLENAARHAPGVPVTVRTRQSPGRVEILVKDRGPGVAPDVRPRLFQWGARRVGSPGQGIGLHHARHLVRRQSGDLSLVDGPGPGATFVIGLRTSTRGSEHTHVARTVTPTGTQ